MEIIKYLIIKLLRAYKMLVSPLLDTIFGKGCIYTPTCSEYAIRSLEKYGIVKGIVMSIKRFIRCHPGASSAYDPVPGD